MALVGAEVKRKEDPRLITGTSAYVSDIAVPGLHHVVFVRSPHAHARIRGIDTAAAAGAAGRAHGADGSGHPRRTALQCPPGGDEQRGWRERHRERRAPALSPLHRIACGTWARRWPRWSQSRRPWPWTPRPTWWSTGNPCPPSPMPFEAMAAGRAPALRRRAGQHRARQGDQGGRSRRRLRPRPPRGEAAHGEPAAGRHHPGASRGPGRARSSDRRHRGVGHPPGAPHAAQRHRELAGSVAEPGARDRARGGRRLRREVRALSGGRDPRRHRPSASASPCAGRRRATST